MAFATRARLAEIAPWAALCALAAALALQDLRSLDYWWHLRTGQLIFETGAVPKQDVFNYTTPGARWVDIYWLYQLGLYGLYSLGGHALVVIAQLALVGAMLAALAPIGFRRERTWLSVGALAWMLLVQANRFEPRPELPSFVLLACVLYLLDRFERSGDRSVYAIVPLQLLWANLHGFFGVGIAVCGLHLAGELLRPLGKAGERLRVPRVRRLAAVILLSSLVAFVNPNGIDGALFPVTLFGMVGPADARGFSLIISELLPPIEAFGPLALFLFLGLAAVSFGAIAANWRNVREADILVWVAFFYLAMAANRNVALFAVVAAPILVRNGNALLDRRALSARAQAVATGVVTALALLVAGDAAAGRFFSRIGSFSTPGLGVIEGFNPIGAADWILRARPPQPLANSRGDGGYLIWRLWPAYQVMNDGRHLEVFGLGTPAALFYDDPQAFVKLDERYHFGTVLLSHRRGEMSALISTLHAVPTWKLAYLDDVSVVFVRAEGEGARMPELDLDAPGVFESLEGVGDIPARERFVARARLLLRLGRPDLAEREWQPYLARFPNDPRGPEALARMRALAAGASDAGGASPSPAAPVR